MCVLLLLDLVKAREDSLKVEAAAAAAKELLDLEICVEWEAELCHVTSEMTAALFGPVGRRAFSKSCRSAWVDTLRSIEVASY